MRLFNDFILIKLEAEKTQLSNGLNVKETRGKRDIVQGTVVATVEGIDPKFLGAGDIVLFPLYAANQVTIDDQDYVVVAYKDLILKK